LPNIKILITENQYNKLNKSIQGITNAIIKYMNEYIDKGERKIVKKSRNYGNLREDSVKSIANKVKQISQPIYASINKKIGIDIA